VICAVLGLYVLWFALRLHLRSRQEARKRSGRSVGVVVANVYQDPDGFDDPAHFCVVEYGAPDGTKIRRPFFDIGRSRPHDLGVELEVRYTPGNPSDAELVRQAGVAAAVHGFIAAAGLLFIGCAAFM
jgi:hypothetical protein